MQVTFWGVRGTISTPEKDKMKFGGNTTCLEVSVNEDMILILDAGTGIYPLGKDILARYKDKQLPPIYIFLSHTHWDHIYGFPFFDVLFKQGAEVNLYGPKKDHKTMEEIIIAEMHDDFYPLHFEKLPANIKCLDLEEGEMSLPGGVKLISQAHCHPGGAYSYRIEHDDKIFVFHTDIEYGLEHLDERIIEMSKGADLIVHEAQYTQEELPSRLGWGHSSWEQAVEVAQKAGAKMLGLTHHDPGRTDKEILAIEKNAKKVFKNSFFAKEGMSIKL